MPSLPHPKNVHVCRVSQTADSFDYYWAQAWDSMLIFDASTHQHTAIGGSILAKGSPRLANVRCTEIADFLRDPQYDHCQWFLSTDADMDWEHDALCQLLGAAYGGDENADPNEPIYHMVGGLCFAGGPHEIKPTVYAAEQSEDGAATTTIAWDYPRDAIVECAGTGAAFVIIHRQLLLHMAQPHPTGFGTFPNGDRNPTPWFAEGIHAGREFGEDIAFCQRARALGYKIAVNTSTKVKHWKKAALTEEVYDARRLAAQYAGNASEEAFLGEAIAEYRRLHSQATATVATGTSRAERRRLERQRQKGKTDEHSG